ncbi:hypothetical protein ACJ41O_011084 [Fusarium nematophilum]
MTGIFHLFGALPKELRDEIWQFAIRPSRPAVHIFRTYNQSKGECVGIHRTHIVSLGNGLSSSRLAVPASDQAAANNPSAYLIDWGLWTACKESRVAMQRHLQRESQVRSDQKTREEPLSATTCFSGGGDDYSDTRFLTIFPRRDLCIIQPRDLQTVDWASLRFRVPAPNVSTFTSVKNIALEFRPEWGASAAKVGILESLYLPIIRALVGVAEHADNLWLVDYSLKRRRPGSMPGGGIPVSEGQTFYARGRRFVEVTSKARRLGRWRHVPPVEDLASSDLFLSTLTLAVLDPGRPEHCRLGLLACEGF